MTDAAIIKATFSEWRMVKGRKVLQIICEVPLEQQGMVFGALGAPLPDETTWVAIARLREGSAEPTSVPVEPATEPDMLPPPKPRKSLAQIAGILCSSVAFQKWSGNKTEEEAAEWLRGHCNVTSRSQLDTNEDAAFAFREIRGDFDAWMMAPEVYSPREERAA